MGMACYGRNAARAGLWGKDVAIYADKKETDKREERKGGENRQYKKNEVDELAISSTTMNLAAVRACRLGQPGMRRASK